MLFVVLLNALAALGLAWLWYYRPTRVLARLEDRYNIVVPRFRLKDVTNRITMLGLRLDTRFIEAGCQVRALAGRVLKRPTALQAQIDQLTIRKAGPAVVDELMGLVIRDLQDAAEKAGRTEEYTKLTLYLHDLLQDFHRHQRLREQLLRSDQPVRASV